MKNTTEVKYDKMAVMPNHSRAMVNRRASLYELEKRTRTIEEIAKTDDATTRRESYMRASGFLVGLLWSGIITSDEYRTYSGRMLNTLWCKEETK